MNARSRNRRRAPVPAVMLLLAACALTASGCKGKDETAPRPPGQAAAPQKLTPEQEAQIRQAEQEGPAIQAANQPPNQAAPQPANGGQ